MPEAFVEAQDLRREIMRLRPEWLSAQPRLYEWRLNESDWRSGFWRRVRREPNKMAKIISTLDEGTLDQARNEAKAARSMARDVGHRIEGLRLDSARSWYLHDVPGWDGEPFEAWRGLSESQWWQALLLRRNQTFLDWLEPWLELDRIRSEHAKWIAFWTRDCEKERLPREWLRWAMREVQALRKVTRGTPVDNQISTYLMDYDIFVTGDRAFAECIEIIRPHSPAQIAATSVAPAGSGAIDHLLELFETVAVQHRRSDLIS
jgi:hypothetical protein